MDQKTFKLELRLRPHQKLILFNITNIRDSDVILEFSWLETTDSLIFWARRIIAFPEEPNRKIFLLIVIKEKSLYFNTIYSKELITHL